MNRRAFLAASAAAVATPGAGAQRSKLGIATTSYMTVRKFLTRFVALAVGVIGVARGLGLSRREALLGALLVATLPVIALQASTAQNDLVVAAFLVAAVALLLDTGRGAPWIAGGATALAVGTKVTAVFGIPILLVVAFLAASTRRGQRLTCVLVGAAAGAYWYVVNWS